MNAGCGLSQYAIGQACSNCDSSCYTCSNGGSSDCTSCDLGKYLYRGACLNCDATGMILGSSG
jgi:hypothetical protein